MGWLDILEGLLFAKFGRTMGPEVNFRQFIGSRQEETRRALLYKSWAVVNKGLSVKVCLG